jgi:hypothetical protein
MTYRATTHERVGYMENLNVGDGAPGRVFSTHDTIDSPSIAHVPSFQGIPAY